MSLKNKRLTLFFSLGSSLESWDKNGMLQRELDIYGELAKSFDKIYFLTYGLNDKKYAKKLPKNIVVLPKKYNIPDPLYSFVMPFTYKKQLRNTIIKTHQMLGGWASVLRKLFFGNTFIARTGYIQSKFTQNTTEKFRTIKLWFVYCVEYVFYNSADLVICTLKCDRRDIIKWFGIKPKKVKIVTNSMNTDVFKPKAVKNKKDIIFVGRFNPQKNVLAFAKAIKDLPYSVTMVGAGELKEKVKYILKDRQPKIEYVDRVANHELPEIITKHKVFCLPSHYESNPKTLLEAMSCGAPCITSHFVGEINEFEHKKDIHLISTNPAAIKKALITLMEDDEYRDQLSKGARSYIVNRNNMKKNIKAEIKIITELVGEKRK